MPQDAPLECGEAPQARLPTNVVVLGQAAARAAWIHQQDLASTYVGHDVWDHKTLAKRVDPRR